MPNQAYLIISNIRMYNFNYVVGYNLANFLQIATT